MTIKSPPISLLPSSSSTTMMMISSKEKKMMTKKKRQQSTKKKSLQQQQQQQCLSMSRSMMLIAVIIFMIHCSSTMVVVVQGFTQPVFTTTSTRSTSITPPSSFFKVSSSSSSSSFSSSSALYHGGGHGVEHHQIHAFTSTGNWIMDDILLSPLVWSAIVMVSIVVLLSAWEESIKALRTSIPSALLSVVESMLAEMGGLGFIGLFLSSFVLHGGIVGETIETLSETFLGDEEILIEAFENLHTSFFQVGIGFFVVSGWTVYAVLREVQKLQEISELALDTDGDGEVSLDELADALQVESLVVDADGDGIITPEEVTDALRHSQDIGILPELRMTPSDIAAESLVIRERLILSKALPDCFLVERYFEQIFAKNLDEIVELSPMTWLPLIPLISLQQAADLRNNVISSSSSNAFATCGEFISSPLVFYPTLLFQIIGLVWALYNFWKMTMVKGMLMPTLVRDGGEDGPAVLLPPRVEDSEIRSSFSSTPTWIQPLERIWGEPARNDHEGLFGTLGEAGPEFFLTSIKLQIWLNVAQIVFYGGGVFARDLSALAMNDMTLVGNPDALMTEIIVYGIFLLSSLGQLYLAPRTFLNYSFATSVESMIDGKALKTAIRESIYEYEVREGKRYESNDKEVPIILQGQVYTDQSISEDKSTIVEAEEASATATKEAAAAAASAVVAAAETATENVATPHDVVVNDNNGHETMIENTHDDSSSTGSPADMILNGNDVPNGSSTVTVTAPVVTMKDDTNGTPLNIIPTNDDQAPSSPKTKRKFFKKLKDKVFR